MNSVRDFQAKTVGVLGMARSGLAAARALRSGGASVIGFDDGVVGRRAAEKAGIRLGGRGDVAGLAAVVASPGIPLTHPKPHPIVERCRRLGVPLTCDVQLFATGLHQRGNRLIAVTGTNGKSTTTALIYHLLREAGLDPVLGGNIGKPVFDLEIARADQPVVLEVSSFQLDLCNRLAPEIAVWLNLTPDHLDRHGDMAGYIAAKCRIFLGQSTSDTAIVGLDESESRAIAGKLADERCITIGSGREARIRYVDGVLLEADRKAIDLRHATNLRGAHNWQNAAAAVAAARQLADRPAAFWEQALASFAGLPHRMERVASCDGVTFINDSKATNPDAASKSLSSFDHIYWIAGGKPKPGGFIGLCPYLSNVRAGFLIGQAADAIANDVGGVVDTHRSGTLEEAATAAFAAARRDENSVVLLAPACASFDQFPSFEARGDRFREIAKALCAEAGAA